MVSYYPKFCNMLLDSYKDNQNKNWAWNNTPIRFIKVKPQASLHFSQKAVMTPTEAPAGHWRFVPQRLQLLLKMT